MMRLMIMCFAVMAFMSAPARAEELQPILQLDLRTDENVTRSATLYASDIDPNSRGESDRYRFEIDGAEVTLPETLLGRLDTGRRTYSYDTFTDGITSETSRIQCMMAGPAIGWVLSVQYLTYEASRITNSEMQRVLSEAENCLFTTRIRPVSDEATRAATGALATLRTLIELQDG